LPVILQLTQALMPLIQMFANLMTHSKLFSSVVLALTAALVVMVATIWLANAGLFTLNAQVLLIPAIIAGVIVGLILLYQKCAWFRGAVQAAMHAVVAAFNWVKQAAVDVFNWVKGHWPLLVGLVGGPLALAVAEAVKHFGSIKQAAVDAFNKIKSVIGTVSSFISSTLGGAFNGVKGAVQGVVDTIQTMIDTAQKIESLPAKALKALNPFGQHGLYMSTGGTAVVGEAGPEMVRLPQGAQVMPFMQGRGGSGGGGGQVVVPVYLDKRQIALAMGSYTADEQAAR
jgi:phage-related protein